MPASDAPRACRADTSTPCSAIVYNVERTLATLKTAHVWVPRSALQPGNTYVECRRIAESQSQLTECRDRLPTRWLELGCRDYLGRRARWGAPMPLPRKDPPTFKMTKMPPMGIAPMLPAPQAGVLLLDYSGARRRAAFIGTRTRILTLEGLNTTLVL